MCTKSSTTEERPLWKKPQGRHERRPKEMRDSLQSQSKSQRAFFNGTRQAVSKYTEVQHKAKNSEDTD